MKMKKNVKDGNDMYYCTDSYRKELLIMVQNAYDKDADVKRGGKSMTIH